MERNRRKKKLRRSCSVHQHILSANYILSLRKITDFEKEKWRKIKLADRTLNHLLSLFFFIVPIKLLDQNGNVIRSTFYQKHANFLLTSVI